VVLSVTLNLIAISEMANKVRKPRNEEPGTSRNEIILSRRLDKKEIQDVGILGYADDCLTQKKSHVMYKLLERLILQRIQPLIEAATPVHQAGFRKHRSYTEQVMALTAYYTI
jgi:hypothetical protein